jgi:hypothetical protein
MEIYNRKHIFIRKKKVLVYSNNILAELGLQIKTQELRTGIRYDFFQRKVKLNYL